MAETFDPVALNKVFAELSVKLLQMQTSVANLSKSFSMLGKEMAKSIPQEQIDRVEETNKMISQMADHFDTSTSSVKKFGTTYEKTITKSSTLMGTLESQILSTVESFTKFIKANEFLSGTVDTVKFYGNAFKGLYRVVQSVTSGIFMMGQAILSAPFQVLKSLVREAEAGGGGNELFEAYEKVRESFGSFREFTSRNVIDSARSMKGELANTGLSVYRTFGNLAQRLAFFREMAEGLGPVFGVLGQQIAQNAEAIGAFQKGLGLSNEHLKAIGARAIASGQPLSDSLREIGNYALQMGSAFGISSKLISRDIGEMTTDFKHFGGLGTQEMAKMSVFARKLGVDFSKLLGVVDRFDNFEDAAQGAAQLSQAFGLNVDAIKLMNAQNPAERIEMLRKSFFAAGRSIETMTRQERNLLATQTGLDAAVLDQVFSLKNQGVSYDQIARKSDAAKRSQLDQTQVLKGLSDNIQRLAQQGQHVQGSFFERFAQGFMRGIRHTQEFMVLMRNLSVDLRETFTAGIRVGRDFVKFFPGVKDIFGGLAQIFQPATFRRMLNGVVGEFRKFFKALTTDPQTALPNLLKGLKDKFFSFFDSRSAAGQRVLEGYKKFFGAIGVVIRSGLKIGIESLTNGFKYITALLKGEAGLSGGSIESGGILGKLIDSGIKFFRDVGGPALLDSAVGMFETLFHKLVEQAPKLLGPNLYKIIGALFGPAIIRTAMTSLLPSIFSGVIGGIGKAGGAFVGLLSKASKAGSALGAVGRAGGGARQEVPSILGERQAGNLTGGMSKLEKFGVTTAAKVGLVLVAIAGALAIGGVLLALSVRAIAGVTAGLSDKQIITSLGIIATTALATVPLAFATQLVSKVPITEVLKGLGAMVLILGGVGLAAYGVGKLMEKVNVGTLATASGALLKISMALLATAPIIGAATLVGALISGPQILVTLVGLAAMSTVLAGVTQTTIAIMETVNRIQIQAGFQEKINAFTSILQTIGVFTGKLSDILTAVRPSLSDLIRGRSTSDNINSLNSFIREMIGTPENNSGIMGLVTIIRNSVQNMSQEDIQKASTFGTLLGSVGSLVEALVSPVQILSQNQSFLEQLGGSNIAVDLGHIGIFIDSMRSTITQLIRSVIGIVSGIGGDAETVGRMAGPFATILTSVGSIFKAINLSGDALRSLTSTSGNYSIAGVLGVGGRSVGARTGVDPEAINALGQYASQLIRALVSSGFFTQVQQLIGGIVTQTSGLNADQARTVEKVAPLVSAVVGAISSIGGIANNIINSTRGIQGVDAVAFQRIVPMLGTFTSGLFNDLFSAISTNIPRVIASMQTAFAGIPDGQLSGFQKKIDAIKSVFEIVTTIGSISSSFATGSGGRPPHGGIIWDMFNNATAPLRWIFTEHPEILQGVFTGLQNPMLNNASRLVPRINAVKTIFEIVKILPEILSGFGGVSINSEQLSSRVATAMSAITAALNPTVINNAFQAISQIEIGRGVAGKLTNLKNVFVATKDAQTAFVDLMSGQAAGAESLSTASVDATANSIARMVSKVRQINAELNSLRGENIDLRPRLRAVANNLGLGSSDRFTIDRGSLQVNVNVTVTMDAKELEKILIERPDSRIQTRGNRI